MDGAFLVTTTTCYRWCVFGNHNHLLRMVGFWYPQPPATDGGLLVTKAPWYGWCVFDNHNNLPQMVFFVTTTTCYRWWAFGSHSHSPLLRTEGFWQPQPPTMDESNTVSTVATVQEVSSSLMVENTLSRPTDRKHASVDGVRKSTTRESVGGIEC